MNIGNIKKEFPDYDGQIEHIEEIHARGADTVPPKMVLPYRLAQDLPFDTLYSHQYKALESLNRNNHVCVTTPTSSGKTLVYGLEIARQYYEDNSSTALLVYPTKALSRDQKEELEKLYDNLNLNIDIGVYDGDSSQDEKRRIRRQSNVIITNFQGLNYYIPYHKKWNRIFQNLSTVVIDEAHTYTGVQGMHVSWIIRRLRRIVENYYDSLPSFILSSATIGNPEEHAKNLTGYEFDVISEDGSPRGKRDIVIWNPPSYIDDDSGTLERKSPNAESSEIAAYLANKDLQSLMFAPSRKTTELCAKWTQDTLNDDYAGFYDVDSYNAGHRKSDRREVESKLKKGELDAVVSTTALELGIDIGGVDATIMNGYPGRKASFWQQAGRSGRGTNDAISFLVTQHDSIDQFIVDNPDYLLNSEVENAVVDLDNKHVLKAHLCAASNEMPLKMRDVSLFTDGPFMESLEELYRQGYINASDITEEDIKYIKSDRPESRIDLYSSDSEQFDVYIDLGDDTAELPSVDKYRAYRDFHPRAIHMYKGNQYEVTEFDKESMEIYLEYVEVGYYTQSSRDTEIKNLEVIDTKEVPNTNIKINKGKATIAESYSTYTKIYFKEGRKESNLPTTLNDPIELRTDAMWIEYDRDSIDTVSLDSGSDGVAGGLHAAEHSLIKMSPTIITADSKDIGGLSNPMSPATDKPTIFVYDGIEGGVGFSHKIYENIEKLSERTVELLNSCDCESKHGCPACTMSSMCGDNNEPMDVDGGISCLEFLYN